MSVQPIGDVLKSLSDYLRSVPEVVALVSSAAGWQAGASSGPTSGPRIGGARHANWSVPTQAVVIRRAGGTGAIGAGHYRSRLDVWCYGKNALECVNLYRTVHPAIMPDPGAVGWTAAGVRVANAEQDADPIPVDDADLEWPALVVPYVLTWRTL